MHGSHYDGSVHLHFDSQVKRQEHSQPERWSQLGNVCEGQRRRTTKDVEKILEVGKKYFREKTQGQK